MASVSASHSCGNSWATWETGQCCWQSCSPASGIAFDGGRVALVGEDAREHLDRAQLGAGRRDLAEPVLDERHPLVCERLHGLVTAGLVQEPERLDREVVVLLVEALAPALGEREHLRRASAAAVRLGARLARLDRAVLDQLVEMAAYGGGREVQPLAERRRGGRSFDEDRPGHAMPRRLVLLEYHNTSVPLMRRALQGRSPLPGSRGPRPAAHLTGDILRFMVGSILGNRVRRVEDPELIDGRSTYVDDLRIPGTTHAVFVRSPLAHATITHSTPRTPSGPPASWPCTPRPRSAGSGCRRSRRSTS